MKRKTIYPLNQDWLLISGNGKEDCDFHKTGIPVENAVTAQLPCYTHMYIEDHLGLSWYQKEFQLEEVAKEGEIALLCFEKADFRTEVSVNGIVAGSHVGIEDPFSFDVTKLLKKGTNRLTVRVSKPYEKDLDGYCFDEIPHRNQRIDKLIPGWCYNESGICGEVTLKFVPSCYVDDLFLDADPETGVIRVEMSIMDAREAADGNSCQETEARVKLTAARSPEGDILDTCEAQIVLHPGLNTVEFRLQISDFRLWELENPVLYAVNACLSWGGQEHWISRRTGFRSFVVREDGYFALNGKRIFIKSSHTGNCMPLSVHHISRDKELLRKDFLMAKAVGFNMIRFIAGTALPIQLDLCDEIGLMVYEEPASSWLEKNGPHARELYRHDLLTMIRRDRNHPSITIWGLLNETHLAPPFDEVCREAQGSLPALRELDQSRLVLFSSGRWDKQQNVGSVCNPYHTEWQTLWNGEGMLDRPAEKEPMISETAMEGGCGDIHYYARPPYSSQTIAYMRNWGAVYKRPVFLSESGTGSVLDTISLVNRFVQDGNDGIYPDVKKIKEMNDIFHAELKKYGFDRLFPFPSELMRSSMQNHARYRTQAFDITRANPYINGLSLTGLLDHSICGEGLWTLYREYKPQIADVLQDGYAKLRISVLPKRWAVYRGEQLEFEIAVSNEDVLQVGSNYEVRSGVFAKGKTYEVHNRTFAMTEEDAKGFAVPVGTERFATAELEEGIYTCKTEFVSGVCAAGGIKEFYVYEHATSKTGRGVYVTGAEDAKKQWLAERGFRICTRETFDMSKDVVMVGDVTRENITELKEMLQQGAAVVALHAAEEEDLALELLPVERRPKVERTTDWLYHKEYVLSPESPFFDGLEAGVMNCNQYTEVITSTALDARDAEVPDVTHAIAFCTGYCNDSGYIGGYKIGTYDVGKGSLTLNTFRLLEVVEREPLAERMLVNILDHA